MATFYNLAPIYCTDAKEINNSKILSYLVNKLQLVTVVLSILPFYVTILSHSACALTALWIQRMWSCIEYSHLDMLHNFTLHEKCTCTVRMFISLRYSCHVIQFSLQTEIDILLAKRLNQVTYWYCVRSWQTRNTSHLWTSIAFSAGISPITFSIFYAELRSLQLHLRLPSL